MQGIDAASSVLNAALTTVAVAGLAWRCRLAAARFFAAYLAYGVISRIATWTAPAVFYVQPTWFIVDGIHMVLRYGVAAELLWLTFGRLPGGARRGRLVLALTALAALGAAALPPGDIQPHYGPIYPLWLRVTQAGYVVGLAFVATLVLTVRNGLPMAPLHRAIAAGMIVLSVLHTLRPLLAQLDPYLPLGRGAAMKLTYPLLALVWARAAWRPDEAEASALSPEAVRVLQPWRRVA